MTASLVCVEPNCGQPRDAKVHRQGNGHGHFFNAVTPLLTSGSLAQPRARVGRIEAADRPKPVAAKRDAQPPDPPKIASMAMLTAIIEDGLAALNLPVPPKIKRITTDPEYNFDRSLMVGAEVVIRMTVRCEVENG